MFIIDALIAVAPLIGYYSQYSLMKQTRSVGTFSIDVCAILIFANILRIGFWFSKGFANNLLIQSFFVIGFQFLILDLCVRLGYKRKQQIHKQGIWRWNTMNPFIMMIVIFSAVIFIITTIFVSLKIEMYGTIIGLVSLSIEATLGIPQLVSNQTNKSVEGLSIFMIITWFVGDFGKTLYFIIQKQPFQFILCGAVQLTVDVLVIIQIMAFMENTNYVNVKDEVQHQTQEPEISDNLQK